MNWITVRRWIGRLEFTAFLCMTAVILYILSTARPLTDNTHVATMKDVIAFFGLLLWLVLMAVSGYLLARDGRPVRFISGSSVLAFSIFTLGAFGSYYIGPIRSFGDVLVAFACYGGTLCALLDVLLPARLQPQSTKKGAVA